MGRPPLHPELRRVVYVKMRTTEKAKRRFLEVANKHGYDMSMAMREAMVDWIKKKEQL